MAASNVVSVWAKNDLAFVNWDYQVASTGLCDSLGIISSITGRLVAARVITYNGNSGYAPFSGHNVRVFTADGYDVLRSYGAALVSSNTTLTRHYSQASLDFTLINDSLRLQVSSGGADRIGRVQLALSYDW